MKVIANNKKAYFDYEVVDDFVAGIKLEGREVKSLRSQKPNFSGSFITLQDGRAWIHELNIPRYKYDGTAKYEPTRRRELLLKASEIKRLEGKLHGEGVTVVPLEIGFDRQWAKVRIALVRGKKLHEKRQKIKEREEKRFLQRRLKRG